MLTISSLASSSAGNCYHVSDGQSSILLEAGIPWPRIRKGVNFKTADLAGCLVSHSHKDHAKAIPDVCRNGIDCYASQETFDSFGVYNHRAIPVKAKDQVVMVGGWKVKPFDTVHDVPGSLGYFIQSYAGDRLLFMTDTAYVRYRFPGLTHVIIEANFSIDIVNCRMADGELDEMRKRRLIRTHMSVERVLDFLRANDTSRIVEIRLIHLSAENSDAELFKSMVQSATGKPVYVEAA